MITKIIYDTQTDRAVSGKRSRQATWY